MSSTPNQSAESNPAIFRCRQAWTTTFEDSLAQGMDQHSAQVAADSAYLDSMPPLYGTRNIRTFIACVTYGSLIGVIDHQHCSRLLYAAQVAHATRRTRTPKAESAKYFRQKEPFSSRSGVKRRH